MVENSKKLNYVYCWIVCRYILVGCSKNQRDTSQVEGRHVVIHQELDGVDSTCHYILLFGEVRHVVWRLDLEGVFLKLS